MKKHLMNLATLMMMAVACVGLVSCGGNDGDDEGGNGGGSSTTSNVLVGTWKDSEGAWWESFTFNADGTGTFQYYNASGKTVKQDKVTFKYSFSKVSGKTGTVVFTWTSSGTVVYMKAGNTETRGFTINNNTLYWDSSWGDGAYKKQ